MNWVDMYKLHIDPDVSAYEIHNMANIFNIGLQIYNPLIPRDIQIRAKEKRMVDMKKWILDNSNIVNFENAEIYYNY